MGIKFLEFEYFLWFDVLLDFLIIECLCWRSFCEQFINMILKENIMRYVKVRVNILFEMVEKVVFVRIISYEQIDGQKIKRDVIFCYDFEVLYFW